MGFCPWAAGAGGRGRCRLKLWQPNSRKPRLKCLIGELAEDTFFTCFFPAQALCYSTEEQAGDFEGLEDFSLPQ